VVMDKKYKCKRCGEVLHISLTDKATKKFKAHKATCHDLSSKESHPGFVRQLPMNKNTGNR